MDTTQLLLTIVLTVSTIFLIILGVQLILVLKELRTSLIKINSIVEGFESVGVGLEHGLTEVVGFFHGIKSLLKVFDFLGNKKNERSK
jgi:uncharacterized protein YoxC